MAKSAQIARPPKKAERTKQKVLELCLAKFAKKGVDATTMRDLASAAGLSLGAFYYHFPAKEAVIQVFYEQSFVELETQARLVFRNTDNFEERLLATLEARIDTFVAYRPILIALSRAATDPTSPLCPFTEGTKEIRERAIALFADMLAGSGFKCDKRLRAYLPTLLWMYMMGIVLYWVFDESPKQKNTYQLIRRLTPQLVRLIGYTRLPLTGSVLNPFLQTLHFLMPDAR